MSVINQVLRDLDKRQQRAQGARVRSHYQPAAGRPWLWFGTLSAAILISAALTWWLVAYAFSPTEQALTTSPVSTPELTTALPSQRVQPDSAQLPPETAEATATQEVADEPPARSGNATEQVVATPPRTVYKKQPSAQTSQTEAGVTTNLEPAPEVAGASAAGTEQSPAQTEPEAAEDRGEINVERVERSASELAAQRLDQAVGAMENGQGRKAETLLQEALVLAPQFVDARQQLAAYYYGRGFISEALRVLREGLAHTPSDERLLTLSARIYEESGRADEALAMLNRVDAQLPQQNDILVLRAAMANELGQHQNAADDYRQLLAVNPHQGIWWLGLGVAEEGQANYDAARRAYQRAIEDSGLDRASREYARSREEALAAW